MDGPRVCHTERSKSEREKQISYVNTYVESRKMVQMNQFAGRNRDTDEENKHVDTKGGKGEDGMNSIYMES